MSDQPQTPQLPHEDEPLGPVAELAAGAAAEVRAEILGDEDALMQAWQQGVETEGIEASQIGAIVTATLLVVAVLVVTGIWVTTQGINVASGVSEDVEEYAELADIRSAAAEKLTDWKLLSAEDAIYQMPITEAMAAMTVRYEERQAGVAGLVEPPEVWSTQDLINRDDVVTSSPQPVAASTTPPAAAPGINTGVTPLGPDALTGPDGTP
ncbi:MAG: hypothetical protein AAFN13_06220 [Bacteroidota bacterium]